MSNQPYNPFISVYFPLPVSQFPSWPPFYTLLPASLSIIFFSFYFSSSLLSLFLVRHCGLHYCCWSAQKSNQNGKWINTLMKYTRFFSYSSVFRHLGYFDILTIVNSALMSIRTHWFSTWCFWVPRVWNRQLMRFKTISCCFSFSVLLT